MAAASADTVLKRTPLYDKHVAAGAKLVPFAGWEMPVEYQGVKQEHLATRATAGVFDVSHMGEVVTSGPDAEAFLQRLLSNDVSKLQTGGAQYSLLCREDGGVLDDLFTYRLAADRFLTVTNAANHEKDFAWFARQAADSGLDVTVEDVASQYAMLAVQGPQAREIVGALSDGPLPDRLTCRHRMLRGRRVLVCGTGYPGEDGVELLLAPADAPGIWDEVVRRGAVPAGLAA
ncbi:MAG TPA: glycine cleavage system protein T, partial [Baekduia sp.]